MLPVNVLLFSPLESIFVTIMSFTIFVSMANGGLSEVKGFHMQYSKFLNCGSSKQKLNPQQKHLIFSSKVGMFVLYFPAFLFGVSSFLIFNDQGLRFLLLRLALTIHFLKRLLEVLFVHKFGGGGVTLDAAIMISLTYLLASITLIQAQHLTRELPEPAIDLKYVGVGLFLMGLGGNFYHHYILSILRNKGDKEYYKIPKGGLFSLVICPHYLFEVLGFVGVSCIAQTIYALSYTVAVTLYLLGRSYATKKWYLSKFDDFPEDVKLMIPFII